MRTISIFVIFLIACNALPVEKSSNEITAAQTSNSGSNNVSQEASGTTTTTTSPSSVNNEPKNSVETIPGTTTAGSSSVTTTTASPSSVNNEPQNGVETTPGASATATTTASPTSTNTEPKNSVENVLGTTPAPSSSSSQGTSVPSSSSPTKETINQSVTTSSATTETPSQSATTSSTTKDTVSQATPSSSTKETSVSSPTVASSTSTPTSSVTKVESVISAPTTDGPTGKNDTKSASKSSATTAANATTSATVSVSGPTSSPNNAGTSTTTMTSSMEAAFLFPTPSSNSMEGTGFTPPQASMEDQLFTTPPSAMQGGTAPGPSSSETIPASSETTPKPVSTEFGTIAPIINEFMPQIPTPSHTHVSSNTQSFEKQFELAYFEYFKALQLLSSKSFQPKQPIVAVVTVPPGNSVKPSIKGFFPIPFNHIDFPVSVADIVPLTPIKTKLQWIQSSNIYNLIPKNKTSPSLVLGSSATSVVHPATDLITNPTGPTIGDKILINDVVAHQIKKPMNPVDPSQPISAININSAQPLNAANLVHSHPTLSDIVMNEILGPKAQQVPPQSNLLSGGNSQSSLSDIINSLQGPPQQSNGLGSGSLLSPPGSSLSDIMNALQGPPQQSNGFGSGSLLSPPGSSLSDIMNALQSSSEQSNGLGSGNLLNPPHSSLSDIMNVLQGLPQQSNGFGSGSLLSPHSSSLSDIMNVLQGPPQQSNILDSIGGGSIFDPPQPSLTQTLVNSIMPSQPSLTQTIVNSFMTPQQNTLNPFNIIHSSTNPLRLTDEISLLINPSAFSQQDSIFSSPQQTSDDQINDVVNLILGPPTPSLSEEIGNLLSQNSHSSLNILTPNILQPQQPSGIAGIIHNIEQQRRQNSNPLNAIFGQEQPSVSSPGFESAREIRERLPIAAMELLAPSVLAPNPLVQKPVQVLPIIPASNSTTSIQLHPFRTTFKNLPYLINPKKILKSKHLKVHKIDKGLELVSSEIKQYATLARVQKYVDFVIEEDLFIRNALVGNRPVGMMLVGDDNKVQPILLIPHIKV